METFTASLQADYVADHLLQAHAHANSGADPTWERHQLSLALDHFAKLEALMPAVRGRLEALNTPAGEAA